MSRAEELKREIEQERKKLNEMLTTRTMEDTLVQSQKLDKLIEHYLDLAD